MKNYLFLFLFCLPVFAFATTYYVDPSSASGTANGQLATPWKTLAQVSSNMGSFQPGDFILFKRGETFSGTLTVSRSGTISAPITFGAYGSGAKPKFTGTGSTITFLFYLNNRAFVIFRDLWITDPSISDVDRTVDAKIQRPFYFDGSTNNCKIISCDIEKTGIGAFFVGGTNTMDSCDVGNLRMVVDTPQDKDGDGIFGEPGTVAQGGDQPGNDDDYGANPLVIRSSNNIITHNNFHDCWADSYDYTYDGGAVEFHNTSPTTTMTNNVIMWNTIDDNMIICEITGNCTNFTIAYNKLINNGSLFYFQSGYTYSNFKFHNNLIIETTAPRVSEARLFGGSMPAGLWNFKNNIIQMSNGVDLFSSGSSVTHTNNIYKMSSGSDIGFTIGGTELSTLGTIFTTTTGDPTTWDINLPEGSPAIDFGVDVGLSKDIQGKNVPAAPTNIPDAGPNEKDGTAPPVAGPNTYLIVNQKFEKYEVRPQQ